MKSIHSKYFVPGIHILIWLLLMAIPFVMVSGKENFLGLTHLFFLLSTLYHIAIFYFNAYFLYPKLLNKKWWWLYILAMAAVVTTSYYLKIFFLKLDESFHLTHENSRMILFGIMPFIIASMLFRLISERLRYERLEKAARAERLTAELKYLRAQVSPHFLFNMMTNMVSLARQRSDLLETSLIRLSDLLRYMLYDAREQKIPLIQELEHVENYITLQQLRFGEDVNVSLVVKNECIDCLIEPMLLVPFIENAFKHGNGLLNNPYITIHIDISNNELRFFITNNYSAANISKDNNSGIGLANVKERLRLLYPGKYKLNIAKDDSVFSVRLNLDLS